MEIDVKDYLSDSEIKEIIREAVERRVATLLNRESDIERFLSNTSYTFVWDAVNKLCPTNMLEVLTAKIPPIVENLSTYEVFRASDVWGNNQTKGWQLLQAAVSEAEPLIKERVLELIKEVDLYMIKSLIIEHLETFFENLQEKQQKKE